MATADWSPTEIYCSSRGFLWGRITVASGAGLPLTSLLVERAHIGSNQRTALPSHDILAPVGSGSNAAPG